MQWLLAKTGTGHGAERGSHMRAAGTCSELRPTRLVAVKARRVQVRVSSSPLQSTSTAWKEQERTKTRESKRESTRAKDRRGHFSSSCTIPWLSHRCLPFICTLRGIQALRWTLQVNDARVASPPMYHQTGLVSHSDLNHDRLVLDDGCESDSATRVSKRPAT